MSRARKILNPVIIILFVIINFVFFQPDTFVSAVMNNTGWNTNKPSLSAGQSINTSDAGTQKGVEKSTIKRAWEALTAGELDEFLSIVWTKIYWTKSATKIF